MVFRTYLGLILALVLCSLVGSQERPVSPTARLIELLGSAVFAERAKAEAELGKLAEVPTELRRAARSTDPEVRRRAKAAIILIESRGKAEKRQEIAHLLGEGKLDLALERTVAWQDADVSDRWSDGFAVLATKLWELQTKQPGYKAHPNKKIDLMIFLSSLRNNRGKFSFLSSDKEMSDLRANTIARAPSMKLTTTSPREAVLLASGDVSVEEGTDLSQFFVVFSAGSVRVEKFFGVAIIVADGDVELGGGEITSALIIARGNVTVRKGHSRYFLTIFAGGQIDIPHYRLREPQDCFLRPNDRTGMGLIKFFETADVGLETVADPKGVGLKAVGPKSIFDGRLRKGDVVTAIDKDAAPDPEKFRRVLRRALTNVGNDVAFHVLREGKAVVVAVAIPALPAAK